MGQTLFTLQEFLELAELRASIVRLHGIAQRSEWFELARHLALALASLPGYEGGE